MPVHKSPSRWNINQCTAFDIYLPVNVAGLSAFSPVGRTLTLQFHHLLAKIAFVTAKQTQSFIGFSAVSGNVISAPKWNTVEVSCMWLNWPWREGKKWKSKRKQAISSCGERRTALHRYSLGFGPRGEKNSAGCIPSGGKGYRNSGEGRAERCLDQRDTNTSAVQLRRDLCRNPTRGAPACRRLLCWQTHTSGWWLWLDFSSLLPLHDLLL